MKAHFLPATLTLLGFATSVHAAALTLTASDAFDTTSFADSGNPAGFVPNWSNGLFPSAGNTYTVSGGLQLRTPKASGDFVFAGDSFTLGAGGTSGTMSVKATGVFTIANFFLNNGQVAVNTDATMGTIAGLLTLSGSGSLTGTAGTGRNLLVTSAVSGSGVLSLSNSSTGGTTVLKPASANTYTGGTNINSSVGFVIGQADGAFGTGRVTVNTGGLLRLELGATNNYIANSAMFALNGTGTADLNYTGTDLVGSLVLGGVTQAPGTYGSSASGAANTSSFFTGTGTITVVPEPGAAVSMLGGVGLLLALRRQRAAASRRVSA